MSTAPGGSFQADPLTVLAGSSSSGDPASPGAFRALTSSDLPSAVQKYIAGLTAGIRLAASTASVTSSTSLNTGLGALVAVVVSLGQSASSGAALVTTSALASTGWTLIQVWSGSASNSGAAVAAVTINWIAVGA